MHSFSTFWKVSEYGTSLEKWKGRYTWGERFSLFRFGTTFETQRRRKEFSQSHWVLSFTWYLISDSSGSRADDETESIIHEDTKKNESNMSAIKKPLKQSLEMSSTWCTTWEGGASHYGDSINRCFKWISWLMMCYCKNALLLCGWFIAWTVCACGVGVWIWW